MAGSSITEAPRLSRACLEGRAPAPRPREHHHLRPPAGPGLAHGDPLRRPLDLERHPSPQLLGRRRPRPRPGRTRCHRASARKATSRSPPWSDLGPGPRAARCSRRRARPGTRAPRPRRGRWARGGAERAAARQRGVAFARLEGDRTLPGRGHEASRDRAPPSPRRPGPAARARPWRAGSRRSRRSRSRRRRVSTFPRRSATTRSGRRCRQQGPPPQAGRADPGPCGQALETSSRPTPGRRADRRARGSRRGRGRGAGPSARPSGCARPGRPRSASRASSISFRKAPFPPTASSAPGVRSPVVVMKWSSTSWPSASSRPLHVLGLPTSEGAPPRADADLHRTYRPGQQAEDAGSEPELRMPSSAAESPFLASSFKHDRGRMQAAC